MRQLKTNLNLLGVASLCRNEGGFSHKKIRCVKWQKINFDDICV